MAYVWSTKVRLPEFNKKTCLAFLEMIEKVSRIAGVPKTATWESTDLGDNYFEVVAKYERKIYYPKQDFKILIKG